MKGTEQVNGVVMESGTVILGKCQGIRRQKGVTRMFVELIMEASFGGTKLEEALSKRNFEKYIVCKGKGRPEETNVHRKKLDYMKLIT